MEVHPSKKDFFFKVANLNKKISKVIQILPKKLIRRGESSLEESVSQVIESHESNNPVEIQEKNMIKNLFEFHDLKVSEVMIPRTDVAAVSENVSYDELKQKFIETRHTRIPIYKQNLDEITGFVHIKDAISYIEDPESFHIDNIRRDLIYAPSSMKCIDLLEEMKKKATRIAVVLDEYGGTEGIVTAEDLLEEIIGDIKDEHEKEVQIGIVQVEDNAYEVDGRVQIETVEEETGFKLSTNEDEFETISGFILAYLGRIPKPKEKFSHPFGLDIEILEADERRVKRVRITSNNTYGDQ